MNKKLVEQKFKCFMKQNYKFETFFFKCFIKDTNQQKWPTSYNKVNINTC